MSVLIKGLKMPKNCDACPMLYEYRLCALTDDHASSIEWKTEEKRMPNCPLIELPDHGDLIDRDELMKHGVYLPRDGGNLPLVYMSYVKAEKAVIPAERGEDG